MIQLLHAVHVGSGASSYYHRACCPPPLQPSARMAFIVCGPRNSRSSSAKTSVATTLLRRLILVSSSSSSSSSSYDQKNTLPPSITRPALPTAEQVGLKGLYPPSVAYRNGTLPVDELHTLYYEEHGRWYDICSEAANNMKGNHHQQQPTTTGTQQQPQSKDNQHSHDDNEEAPLLHALFLHGGPGAGCTPNHARFFNPAHYHIVLLDQRGAGKSTCHTTTTTTTTSATTIHQNNTLQHLIQDCEVLRNHLQIPVWDVVLGGSWGVTLGVAYAQTHPTKIRSLILRGVCLMRSSEINWLFSSSSSSSRISKSSNSITGMAPQQQEQTTRSTAAHLFPNAWQAFANAVNSTDSYPRETLHRYYDRLLGNDPVMRLEAARSWMNWEMTVFVGASSSASDMSSSSSKSSLAAARFYQKAYAPVAVYSQQQHSTWSLQDGQGHLLTAETLSKLGLQNTTCQELVEQLRQNITQQLQKQDVALPTDHSQQTEPRPIRQQPQAISNNNNVTQQQAATSFVPAQNMLTCFYSVNEHYTKNNVNLLDPDRMQRIQHISCIAIHGGLDRVCPVDTALDLLQHWSSSSFSSSNNNTMELRIPLESGHSMYDVAMTNELVCATDRMVSRFYKGRKNE